MSSHQQGARRLHLDRAIALILGAGMALLSAYLSIPASGLM